MRNQDSLYPRQYPLQANAPSTFTGLSPEAHDLLNRYANTGLSQPRPFPSSPVQPKTVQDAIISLLQQKPKPPMPSVSDRLIDEGVRDWIEQDQQQRAARIKTKWPETMEELLAPEANAQATSGIFPLADAAYKGYNGTGFTNSVISSQKTTPGLYANHTGYIPGSQDDLRLELGTVSDDVKKLQQWLNDLGYKDENGRPLAEDGEFGLHTLAAVNSFKDSVLPGGNTGTNRGVVGPTTWEKLYGRVSVKQRMEDRNNGDSDSSSEPINDHSPVKDIVNYRTDNQKFNYLFDQDWSNTKIYETKAEAVSHMVSIEVPVWTLDAKGNKVPQKITLPINKKIAEMVTCIFEDIFNDPEKFPIRVNEIGGFDYRYDKTGSSKFSEHSHGIAIDINYGDNPKFYSDGTHTGRSYEPGKCPYAITEDSSIVKIFEKYGWTWGGNFSTNKDYMHFQWYNNGN
jgi:hypothetical protein